MTFLKNILPKGKKGKETSVRAEAQISRGTVASHHVASIGILLHPHVTEKTAAAASRRTYAFAIAPQANKAQIKKAVENRYGVTVTGVRMVTIPGKEMRRGKQIGWKQGIKKAYATLAEGQTIEIQ